MVVRPVGFSCFLSSLTIILASRIGGYTYTLECAGVVSSRSHVLVHLTLNRGHLATEENAANHCQNIVSSRVSHAKVVLTVRVARPEDRWNFTDNQLGGKVINVDQISVRRASGDREKEKENSRSDRVSVSNLSIVYPRFVRFIVIVVASLALRVGVRDFGDGLGELIKVARRVHANVDRIEKRVERIKSRPRGGYPRVI